MKDIKGKVAVITGAAGGIGYAFAEKAVKEGAKVVITDIRPDGLATAKEKLETQGGDVLAVVADVTKIADIQSLARQAVEKYGKVNMLFNNAGVAPTGITWDTSPEIYRWAVDINVMSVLYGISTFVPIIIKQGDECHVINTASGAALFAIAGFGLYCMTKHAVLAISEALWNDLQVKGHPQIGVTVVMPGYVKSQIGDPFKAVGDENLKEKLAQLFADPIAVALGTPGVEACAPDGWGMEASVAADLVFDAIAKNELYVKPNNEPNDELDKAVALGRLSGENPYPAIIAAFAAMMGQAAEEKS
mgnify:CR=1 FL=1